MMASTTGRGWIAFGESARGISHELQGQPNQDAFRIADDGRGGLIAAVSDGHGAAVHVRSDRGARLAVDAAVEVLAEAARAEAVLFEMDGLSRRIAERWRELVQADLKMEPLESGDARELSPAEQERLAGDPVWAYGATILAAWAARDFLFLIQIGDGDILSVEGGGRASRPLPVDPLLVGNQTTSLCQDQAWERARTTYLNCANDCPDLLLLATDGYANSYRSDEGFMQVGRDYLELLRAKGAGIETELEAILAETSQEGSGDDITLVLLVRDGAATPNP